MLGNASCVVHTGGETFWVTLVGYGRQHGCTVELKGAAYEDTTTAEMHGWPSRLGRQPWMQLL